MFLITGANGNLGLKLIEALSGQGPVRAVVRSEQAADRIRGFVQSTSVDPDQVEIVVLDYLDEAALTRAAEGCAGAVHLVGIIRETPTSSFATAHQGTTTAFVRACQAAGVGRAVYLSILGASTDSANACLASKAEAESILLGAEGLSALVLRVPMVLGENDYASRALNQRARASVSFQLRAASLEQPIYAGDVVQAVATALGQAEAPSAALDLAGPESLSRRALTLRAAAVLGTRTRVISIPFFLGAGVAWVLERVSANPPVSRAMLGVLNHDDRIDPGPAVNALGLTLTPLDEALRRCLQLD
jgi:NADH dehydrogenase